MTAGSPAPRFVGARTIGVSLLLVLCAERAFSQNPPTAVLRGVVLDSLQRPVVDAEIRLEALGRGTRSDSTGRFQIVGLPTGPFYLVARRLGYDAEAKLVRMRHGDTTEVSVILRARPATLGPITSRSRRDPAYSLSADQIARSPFHTVSGLLQRHRRMLGDEARFCSPKNHAPPVRVFINGEQWPLWRLLNHNVRDIQEMKYTDCWDKDPKLRQTLIVNLKPGVQP